ncbi:sigma-54 dependent transcriptional regulator PrdR [Schnuerera sp.]|uniref:sigma-54 dependent transcriptional regulator PrdR n=1 Tax=Schnuerera sp. TaxID=2794844 RepID=UPI002BDEA9F1|nr:sigma-54 dependent transcriptional regulator PrdR [Schnuerera sp.]HSH35020.1 sigma-54 dependent transcriptional regulator PrdR [Schnuerera sp.]
MFMVLKEILVKDVMDDEFLIAYENSSLSEIKEKLITNYKKEIFVYDREDNLQGIITMKDISNLTKEKKIDIHKKHAKDIAINEVITISEDSNLLNCRNLMLKNNIGRLAVLKKDGIIGVIRQEHIRDFYYMKIEEISSIIKNAINYIHEAVCIIDNKGIVIVWNDNAEKLYNLPKEKILGKPLDVFFPNAIDMEVLRTKHIIENRYHEPRKGTYIVISAAPIIVNNKFLGVVSTDKDVTEMREISNKLKEATEKVNFLKNELEKISNREKRFVIGKSKIIQQKMEVAELAAKSNASILILGESGTGKEVFAKYIHKISGLKGEFIPVNCSAIPRELFESEFFGYEEGAFTGAKKNGKAGYFELANKGTLFLDEIGDLPMEMQSKLLRALQENAIRRLGSEQDTKINVRIISATNRDLEELVRKKKFRMDLYYRLNVINIEIPPLRERKEDIILFIKFFLEELNREYNKNIIGIDTDVINILTSYKWKGNVRELRNIMEQMVVLCRDDFITKEMVPEYIIHDVERNEDIDIFDKLNVDEIGLREQLSEYEKYLINKALEKSKGNIVKAANILKIPRSTLHYKMDSYEVNVNNLT